MKHILLQLQHCYRPIRAWLQLALLLVGSRSVAQGKGAPFGRHIQFELYTTTTKAMMREPVYVQIPDTALYLLWDKLQEGVAAGVVKNQPTSPLLLGVRLGPTVTGYHGNPVQSITRDYHSYRINDGSEATLIALGITPDNIQDFQYHVVENDSVELVPWSPVTQLEQRYGARQPYGLLGRFCSPGKMILVEVVNKKDYSCRDGVIFDWRTGRRPVLQGITLQLRQDYFSLSHTARNRGYATRWDAETRVPLDFTFPADSVLSMTIEVERRETMAYAAYLLRHTKAGRDTVGLGFVDPRGQLTLESSWYRVPGHYELRIEPQSRQPVFDPAQLLSIRFVVLSHTARGFYIDERKLLAWALAAVIAVAAGFLGYRRYSRNKLQQEATRRTQAQLQLKVLRAQLNPHFLFNALGSIQNLVNKQDLLQANHFLSRFAGLTRKVLRSSEEELVSLEDELKLAEDYLLMEQLRFGFQFDIKVDPAIVPANIELPFLLLQPFLENAVKHGVSALQAAGTIGIQVLQEDKRLVISIRDNGRGIAAAESLRADAFGLKLSEERIALVNQLYPGQPVTMQITSTMEGTTILLTLTNWL